MSRLTTHVLDIVGGQPGRGVRVRLFRDGDLTPLVDTVTNDDGRCSEPLLAGESFRPGRYRLIFSVADYYRGCGVALDEPPFLDEVELVFGVARVDQHYHVPLVMSPWSYSTYRGS